MLKSEKLRITEREGEKMADAVTTRIAQYIKEKGIKVSAISRETGIPDGILRRSLSTEERNLRADEFLGICDFLGKNPFDFRENAGRRSRE